MFKNMKKWDIFIVICKFGVAFGTLCITADGIVKSIPKD